MITFVSDYSYYGLNIPAIRDGEERVLRVWVGYQLRDMYLKRGFYLYLNLMTKRYGYYENVEDARSKYKILLKEVNRKRKADAILAGKIATKYFDRIVKQCFPDVVLRMNEAEGFSWSGESFVYSLFVEQYFKFDGIEDEYTL